MLLHIPTLIGTLVFRVLNLFGSMGCLFIDAVKATIYGKFRYKVLVEQIMRIGVGSQPVVLLTGIFTGAVLEAQALFQLQTVKMETMGGAVVSVGMFRELGPVITGLMLAGRVGSAMAAEIGTMKVTEQVDALRTMNVDPVDYLVKPRLQAMLISTPILMLEAVLMGIVAAWVVGIVSFGVNQAYWFNAMMKFTTYGDVVSSMVKAVAFAILIGVISCREGLATSDGAVGVGRSTMKAMVYSSVALLVANFLLTMILNQFFPMGFMR
jgi:phospholipid/cholesterol/gamma-HCH transport system permease protein